MKNEFLWNWVFQYNPYTDKWNAFTREDYVAYFNGGEVKSLVSSSKLDTVVEILNRSEGDFKRMEKLLENEV